MRLTFHIPDRLKAELKDAARSEGTSVSAFIAKALEAYLNEKKQKKKKAGNRLLELVRPDSMSTDVWEELERGRVS